MLKSHRKTKNLFLKIVFAEWNFFASLKILIGISLFFLIHILLIFLLYFSVYKAHIYLKFGFCYNSWCSRMSIPLLFKNKRKSIRLNVPKGCHLCFWQTAKILSLEWDSIWVFFFFNNLVIFGCAGSSLLTGLFSLCGERGLLLVVVFRLIITGVSPVGHGL